MTASSKPTILVSLKPTYWPFLLSTSGGVLGFVFGLTGRTGIFDHVGGPLIAITLGPLFAIFAPIALVSLTRQRWARLIGYDDRLQVTYALGIHRLKPSTRLVGDIASARLVELPVKESVPLFADWTVTRFIVSVGADQTTFAVPTHKLMPGYNEAFRTWKERASQAQPNKE